MVTAIFTTVDVEEISFSTAARPPALKAVLFSVYRDFFDYEI